MPQFSLHLGPVTDMPNPGHLGVSVIWFDIIDLSFNSWSLTCVYMSVCLSILVFLWCTLLSNPNMRHFKGKESLVEALTVGIHLKDFKKCVKLKGEVQFEEYACWFSHWLLFEEWQLIKPYS